MLGRSFRVALVVGTILNGINSGSLLWAGFLGEEALASNLIWKVPLTYCVPFCVATYGALANAKEPLSVGEQGRHEDARSLSA